MAEKLDPYAELGIERDATIAEARAAYRRRVKETHPDTPDGNAEAFSRTKRALVVLTNPRKRKQYDETGRVDEDKPDNERAAAINVIERFMEDAIHGFLTNKADDPRKRDLLAEFCDATNDEISEGEASLIQGDKVVAFLRDMRKRFTTTDKADPIGRSLEKRIEDAEQERVRVREMIAIRYLAMKIARTYAFRRDPVVDPGDKIYAHMLTIRTY